MNTGISLTEMASELERRVKTKHDYITPVTKVEMVTVGETNPQHLVPGVALRGLPDQDMELTSWAHDQIAEYTKIPRAYYQRMLEGAPKLLTQSVNRWKGESPSDKRLVRTLDSRVNAWLSDAYRPLDNFDLARHAIPTLQKAGATVRSAQLTETRIYVKAIVMERTVEIKRGDAVRCGAVLRNSEVGNGALYIALFIDRLICDNGAIAESLFRQTHLGKRMAEELKEAQRYISDRTRKIDDAALWSRFDDALGFALSERAIKELTERMQAAAGDKITAPITEVVEEVTLRLGLPGALNDMILNNMASGGDMTRWGLLNAVTSIANSIDDYEDATTLERAGGKILELPPADWRAIAEAA